MIREKVEEKDPTFGNIVLASLMEDQYVPLTLTPNFDDLVYDALYRFLEEKPLVINHDAVAAEFSLTKDRQMIIKLHGDYLFENLQNLDEETQKLQDNMERAFSLALNEYGLIVVGYSGRDTSIMDEVLLSDIEIPEYGIYWCARNRSELSEKARQLLEQDNTYFVEIEGSEPFFTKLASRIPEVSPPGEEELQKYAEKKIDVVEKTIEQGREDAKSEEEEEYLDTLQYRSKSHELAEAEKWDELRSVASELTSVAPEDPSGYFYLGFAYDELGNYDQAVKAYDKAIELGPNDQSAYLNRGNSYGELGEHERAIEDYDKAIEIKSDFALAYLNRAETWLEIEAYKQAYDDAETAHELFDTTDKLAVSLLIMLISETVINESPDKIEQEYRDICTKEFKTGWRFKELENWLNTADLDDDKKEYILEMIEMLKQHTADT